MRDERPLLCVTGSEPDLATLEARLALPADLHEVRLDLLDPFDDRVFGLLERFRGNQVATCRPSWEMGAFAGPEGDRLAILRRAALAGVAWVDLELAVFERGEAGGVLDGLPPGSRPRVLLSHHEPGGSPGGLCPALTRAQAFPADGFKMVFPVRDAADLDALARAAWAVVDPADPRPVVVLGLGEAGLETRVRPGAFGSAWTYVAASESRTTAPGQVSWERAVRFRVRASADLQPMYLAGGAQVLGSPGPDAYNAVFARQGLPWQYLPLPAARWQDVLATCRRTGAEWLSVTMPFKRDAARSCEGTVDPWVARTGAANTVRVRGGRVIAARNTDAEAAREILAREGIEGPVLILGAGGAAVAVGAAAESLGLPVAVAARDPARVRGGAPGRAAPLAEDWAIVPWEARHAVPHGILVNATPLDTPWDPAVPMPAALVLDLVLRPRGTTPLVARARSEGKTVRDGLDFWCAQGARQVAPLTPRAVTASDLRAVLRDGGWGGETPFLPPVVALAGMRGAGKTRVGEVLARRLGWQFVDTDREAEAVLGRSLADVFREGQQARFRAVEAVVVTEALRGNGVVVATGGGCIEDPAVAAALRTVFCAWLTASATCLADRIRGSGRPPLTELSLDQEVEEVLGRREMLYAQVASTVVPTEGREPDEVCDAVQHAWRSVSNHDLW